MKTYMAIALCIIAGFLTGCASKAQMLEVERVRSIYKEVRDDPEISRYSPVYLYEAEQALENADNADDYEVARYYAYLVEKNIRLAEVTAENKAAEEKIQQLREKRYDILLRAREMEVRRAEQRAVAADEKSDTMQRKMTELQAEKTDRGYVLTLDNVLFETGKAELMAGSFFRLEQLAAFLKTYPDRHIRISGYTDNTGSKEYNQQLSRRRAQAVSKALQDRGISPERIEVRGMGEAYPVATNATAAGRQQNRRVEITILNK